MQEKSSLYGITKMAIFGSVARGEQHENSDIDESLIIIIDRSSGIDSVNDFLTSQTGILLLDGICMKLIAIGESLKNLDKLSNKELLTLYPQIQWKEVI